jgi:biotin operon repressor
VPRSNLTLTDVLPALDGFEGSWTERVKPGLGLELFAPRDVPAVWMLNEFVTAGLVRPPAALSIAQLLVDDTALSQAALASLLPDLVRAGLIDQAFSATTTAFRTLHDAGLAHWAELAAWTPDRLTRRFTRDEATVVVASAIREATRQALHLAPSTNPRPSSLDGAMTTIATWAKYELGMKTLGEALDASEADAVVPSEVQRAREQLRTLALSELAGGDAAAYDLTAALRRLLACPDRGKLILEGRIYPDGTKLTLDELGERLGVTRERVRQIENELKKKIALVLEGGDVDVIKRTARRLRDQIGVCRRLDGLPSWAAWALDMEAAPTAESALHARVLVTMAARFTVRDGWLVRDDVVERSTAEVDRRLKEGAISVEEASSVLIDMGVPASEQDSWLERVCKCRVLDGMVISWKGSMADKAAAVLQVRCEPLSGEEIAEALGPDTNYRSMINQIQADPRFLRRGIKMYGLTMWGGEEYTTIAEEIEQEVERLGGAASLDHLIETLCNGFGVSESSVRAYATSPPFVRTPDDLITMSSGAQTYSRRPIEDCRGCFRVGSHWALRVVVDKELLRGSGRQVPIGVPQLLGIRPGESRQVPTPVGELMVRYARQATMGSLRKAALKLGCVEGDRLFVVFTGDAAIDFVSVSAGDVEALAGVERLAREVGGEPGAAPVPTVAYALGLPSDEYRAAAVRRRLVARKEEEFLGLIADEVDIDIDDDVLNQLIELGE